MIWLLFLAVMCFGDFIKSFFNAFICDVLDKYEAKKKRERKAAKHFESINKDFNQRVNERMKEYLTKKDNAHT